MGVGDGERAGVQPPSVFLTHKPQTGLFLKGLKGEQQSFWERKQEGGGQSLREEEPVHTPRL